LLEASHPEGPRYSYVEAWLDGTTCKGIELRRYTTPVYPIAGGLGYTYRTHCASCAPKEQDELHIVIPTAMSSSAFGEKNGVRYWTYLMEHLELPMSVGTAGTMTAQIEEASIALWNRVVPKGLPVADVELRVETSFAAGEDAPTVLVATRGANILPLSF
jgi:hypothetical protein